MDRYSLWRKNWPKGLPTASYFPYGKMPIADYLKRNAEIIPNKIAVNFYGREMTFKEWDESADKLAIALSEMGYKKGDRAVLYMQNCPQYYIAYIAAARLGLIIFPTDVMYKEFELEYVLDDSGANLVIVLDQLYPIVKAVRGKAQIKDVIVTSFSDYLPGEPALPLPKLMTPPKETFPDTLEFLDLLQKYSPDSPQGDITLDELELVLYTGGTTGAPKGCPHSHEHVLLSGTHDAYIRARGRDLSPCQSTLSFLPVSHVGGLSHTLFPSCVDGRSVTLLTRYDPVTVMQGIDRYSIELFVATVPIYQELLEHPAFQEYDLSSVKLWKAGEWMIWVTPEFSKRWADAVGTPLVKWGYGVGTEMLNVLTTGTRLGYEIPFKDTFMMGTIAPDEGIDIKIVDFDTHKELPVGQQGEIAMKSPGLIKYYWNKPEESKKELTEDGWIYSGDIGKLDEEGYIYWYGRRRYLIRVSGYQVSPGELEMIGRRNPAIAKIAVVGIPDKRKGEIPKAFVELAPEVKTTAAELEQWFKKHIAAYKVPKVEIRSELPLTRKGSIDMKKLLEE